LYPALNRTALMVRPCRGWIARLLQENGPTMPL
jgi:hypothetical protein